MYRSLDDITMVRNEAKRMALRGDSPTDIRLRSLEIGMGVLIERVDGLRGHISDNVKGVKEHVDGVKDNVKHLFKVYGSIFVGLTLAVAAIALGK